jgi:methanogenic corrinoid protein MtbC1
MSGYADYSTLQAAYDAVYDAETRVNHSKEARFNDLLICIASGLTVEQTLDSLPDATVDELCEAHQEALKQGIEPEDIAPSWRRIGY